MIFITAFADVPMAIRAMKSGAIEFVEKPFNRQSLLDRVQRATKDDAERRRLVDRYQAGLIELPELQRRAAAVAARHRDLQTTRASLAEQRAALAHGNRLRRRMNAFAEPIPAVTGHPHALPQPHRSRPPRTAVSVRIARMAAR